jgi:hypothetical protein
MTALLKAFPAKNLGTLAALIVIVSPVRGFLPCRAFLFDMTSLQFTLSLALSPRGRGEYFLLVISPRPSFEKEGIQEEGSPLKGEGIKKKALYSRHRSFTHKDFS